MKHNFNIDVVICEVPILKSDIFPPEGVNFSTEDFINVMRNYRKILSKRALVDGYFLNEFLTEKTPDPAYLILDIIEKYDGFYLKIGTMKQTEAGRMMRYFLTHDRMRLLIGSIWNSKKCRNGSITAKLEKLRFDFVKINKEK